jgi:hypothetical protein
MSEPTYEVWHFDGKRPEILGRGEDKGACRRIWQHSRHAVIALDGNVLEAKQTCGDTAARALRSAIAEAHRRATGGEPEAAPRGVPGGDGKRLLASQSAAVRALDERPVEPMPAPPRDWQVENIPEVEVTARAEEPALPAGVEFGPPRVTRRTPPAPEPKEPAVSTAVLCAVCREPARSFRETLAPPLRDLCGRHRQRAQIWRSEHQKTPAEARAYILQSPEPDGKRAGVRTAVAKPAARPSKPSKAPASKPAAPRPVAEAPVSDLLAIVRRQRATIDALGGIDQAERVAAIVARVGGGAALVQLVDELTGAR